MLAIKLLSNEVAFGKGATAQFQLYENSVAVAPTSGIITLYSPGGAIIINAQIMTVNGNLLQYVFTAANLDIQDVDYRIHIEIIYNSITTPDNFLYDVVLTPLVLSTIDSDLQKLEPDILNDLWKTITTYSIQISEAFDQVKSDIKEKDRRPDKIIDASQVNKLVVYKTFSILYMAFSKAADSIHWQKYLKYESLYENLFKNLQIRYDVNEDGIVDENLHFSTIGLLR